MVSRHVIGSAIALLAETRPESILHPFFPSWTVVKQSLANPWDYRNLEVWLMVKGLEAADVV